MVIKEHHSSPESFLYTTTLDTSHCRIRDFKKGLWNKFHCDTQPDQNKSHTNKLRTKEICVWCFIGKEDLASFDGCTSHNNLCCLPNKYLVLTHVLLFKRTINRLSNSIRVIVKKHCYKIKMHKIQISLFFLPSLFCWTCLSLD